MMCRHRPISNGWSGGATAPPTTWCGRCHEFVAIDREWALTYYSGRRAWNTEDRDFLLQLVDAANP